MSLWCDMEEMNITPKVKCKKCSRLVDDTNRAKWKHAVEFHTDDIISLMVEKSSDAKGNSDLFNLGKAFGEKLQQSGVTPIDVITSTLKGISRYGKAR